MSIYLFNISTYLLDCAESLRLPPFHPYHEIQGPRTQTNQDNGWTAIHSNEAGTENKKPESISTSV